MLGRAAAASLQRRIERENKSATNLLYEAEIKKCFGDVYSPNEFFMHREAWKSRKIIQISIDFRLFYGKKTLIILVSRILRFDSFSAPRLYGTAPHSESVCCGSPEP